MISSAALQDNEAGIAFNGLNPVAFPSKKVQGIEPPKERGTSQFETVR